MRKLTGVFALAIGSVLVVPATSGATVSHATPQAHCKDDGHQYIAGETAKRKNKHTVIFKGDYAQFHPCGEDDGYFTVTGLTTLILTKSTKIKVFRSPIGNTKMKTVTLAQFPAAFKKNKDGERIYRFNGPAAGVKKLIPHFVS